MVPSCAAFGLAAHMNDSMRADIKNCLFHDP